MKLETILKQKVQEAGDSLSSFNWENKNNYVNWLSQTYYFARMTTRLLTLVSSHLPYEDSGLHTRFIDHAGEEKNHDILLMRDLKNLGYNVAEIQELPVTAAFYQSQYYWIQHKSPLSFFGYILILESLAANFGDEAYQRISKAHGKDCASFMRVHATEDKKHTDEALKNIAGLPENIKKQIVENLGVSTGLYIKILQDCQRLTLVGSLEKAG